LSNPEQFVLAAAKLTGEPDVLRSFFKQLSQEFAPGAEWLFAQIFPIQKEQIIGKIDQRDITRAFEYLEQLERRATFLIKRRNFAIEDHAFGCQQFQGIQQLRVIELLFVARDQAHIFAVLEGQCPVSIEFYFVEPVAFSSLSTGSAFIGSIKKSAL
jgi:hypothetical protein